MPDLEDIQDKLPGTPSSATALKAVAAAAVTGAATYAARRAFGHDEHRSKNADGLGSGAAGRSTSFLAAAAATSWEAASEALMPAAEDAAESLGKYLAKHGPDVLRERIVPKFIDAFNNAR